MGLLFGLGVIGGLGRGGSSSSSSSTTDLVNGTVVYPDNSITIETTVVNTTNNTNTNTNANKNKS